MENETKFIIYRTEHEIREVMGGLAGVELTLSLVKNNTLVDIAEERIKEMRNLLRKIADEMQSITSNRDK